MARIRGLIKKRYASHPGLLNEKWIITDEDIERGWVPFRTIWAWTYDKALFDAYERIVYRVGEADEEYIKVPLKDCTLSY